MMSDGAVGKAAAAAASSSHDADRDHPPSVPPSPGVNFVFQLPHMMIGRRVPSPAPKTPPPPPEVVRLPTAFRVPIPRDLPPGPWLPEDMTLPTNIVFSSGEDSDDQNPSVEGGSQRNSRHEQRSALFSVITSNHINAGFDSAGKDPVSSSSKRTIRRRSVHCRPDIENSTPHFLSAYRSLVLPADKAMRKRKNLLLSLAQLVQEEWPNAQLQVVGSWANSFAFPSSDLDLCLSIDVTDHTNNRNILSKLAEILQSKNFQHVQVIANARILVVKMMEPKTYVSCEISINNLLAVANTKLLRDYERIDDRLQQLALIVKRWAKMRNVNNTYQGTLSSYAYVLMCIHFLQLRKPAILPCLQEMEATYFLNVDGIECAYFDRVETLYDFGAQNSESIARLVWEFFNYWANIHNYKNHVISVRTGRLISKESKKWTTRTRKDCHLLCIEDPFKTSHDLGGAVNNRTITILIEEFKRAADILQHDQKPWQTLLQ